MGYCNRCGDIINNSKCRKCGGKPVESIAKGAVDSKASIVDRWQNQYANSILSGPDPTGTTSTPIGKRNSVANFRTGGKTKSPSVTMQPKTCILCHKVVPLGTQLGKNDYCHDCRAKISDSKLKNGASAKPVESIQPECASCSQPVEADHPKVQRQGKTWHKDCIRCSACSNPLANPTALDLNGSSRCVPCQTANKIKATSPQLATSPSSTISSSISSASRFSPIPRAIRNDSYGSTTSISTYDADSTASTRRKSLTGTSSYARPRLDSQLFQQYQKSVNQQQQQPLSPQTTDTTHISSIRPLASQSSSPSLSSYMDKPRMTMSSSTTTTTATGALPKPQLKQRRSSLTPDRPSSNKKTCRKCAEVLRGPRVRLPTPNGDTWYYHYDCLTCAACGDHFTESEFVGDGKDVFHLHCRAPSPATSTPPPLSPTTSSSPDFMSPSTSPIPTASNSSTTTTTQPHLRSRRLSSTPPQPLDYRCHTCSLPIQDKCLKNGTRFFHPNCFTCYSCHEHLPSDRPFYDIQQEAHCEICTQLIIKKGSGATVTTASHKNKNNSSSGNSVADRRRSMPGDSIYGPTPIHTSSTGVRASISSPLSPSTSSPLTAARTGDNGESRIWMNRTRALPKLGGSKICPGCHESIAVMDESPGPKGSKWHKKCLKCTGCKKQMDSAAKVLELNEKLAVRCSDCSDKRSRPHYVR